ncbi:unnamed protein product [Periconia digitata]|uniref:Uncharacterized protein n=1 Tax=Periconia digitata TaxID=1303443 RepID=A0A9W4U1N9_9PLEO|nr:unnamed protein product [Periconia digitata]
MQLDLLSASFVLDATAQAFWGDGRPQCDAFHRCIVGAPLRCGCRRDTPSLRDTPRKKPSTFENR